VSIGCSKGSNLVLHDTYVFSLHHGSTSQTGQTSRETFLDSLHGLRSTVPVYQQADANCCPSAQDIKTWALSGSKWKVIGDAARRAPQAVGRTSRPGST
jgi:hypothetical protein